MFYHKIDHKNIFYHLLQNIINKTSHMLEEKYRFLVAIKFQLGQQRVCFCFLFLMAVDIIIILGWTFSYDKMMFWAHTMIKHYI